MSNTQGIEIKQVDQQPQEQPTDADGKPIFPAGKEGLPREGGNG
jgi:hypothetical protein